jgi:methylisocitrate lyase
MTEQLNAAAAIARSVCVPVLVDGHTGFGDSIHLMRAVRECEGTGSAAIQIEDQVFPKRAHYHRNVKHTIPIDEMVAKIRHAIEARKDADFIIIARTDAHDAVGGSLEETIARMKAYRDAGADILLPFPSPGDNPHDYDMRAARAVREAVPDIPMVWLAGESGSEAEPSLAEIRQAGYQIVLYPFSFMLAAYSGMARLSRQLRRDGKAIIPDSSTIQHKIQDLIGLEAMFRIEEATTESSAGS